MRGSPFGIALTRCQNATYRKEVLDNGSLTALHVDTSALGSHWDEPLKRALLRELRTKSNTVGSSRGRETLFKICA